MAMGFCTEIVIQFNELCFDIIIHFTMHIINMSKSAINIW